MSANNDIAAEMARLRGIFAPHAQSLIQEWLPAGKKESHEWCALNPTRGDSSPGSFKINLLTAEWSDFATGDKGGDVISLRAYLNGDLGKKGAQIAAAKEIAAKLGIVTRFDEPATKTKKPEEKLDWKHAKTWEYQDAEGNAVFETRRSEATDSKGKRRKRFTQCHRGPDGEWVWNIEGCKIVPYRLPELLEDIAQERTIFIVEGEKCVDAGRDQLGIPATCNPMGAGKWWDELTEYFRDADIVIIPDPDAPGHKHAQLVGEKIAPVARRVRVLDLSAIERLGEKEDIFDWVQAGGTSARLYDLVEKHAAPWNVRPIVSAFHAVPYWDLDLPGQEHEWLIDRVLTKSDRSMLAGPSQSGKSFLALDMDMAICRGVEYWGRKTERGGVIYQAGEGGLGLKKRIRAYRVHHGIDPSERLPFVLMPGTLDLHNGDDQLDAFIEECKRWSDMFGELFDLPLAKITLDTLSTAMPGANENDGADMSRILARCARISETLKCHVQFVHHMNAQGTKARGHTSIFANLENVIFVERDLDKRDEDGRPIREARIAKQKDEEDGARWSFVLRGGIETGRDRNGNPITSCVIVPPEGRVAEIGGGRVSTPSRYRGHLTDRQEIAMRALGDAVAEHGQDAPASLGLPAGMRVVEWSKWRERWARLDFNDEAKVQKESVRIGQALLTKRIIGKDGNWVWAVKQEKAAAQEQKPDEPQASWLDGEAA
jgi:hypothetical protein